ncbi:MAG: FAD-dependent oxidoreductase [Hyphomicrobiales bacterium]|nr:FAD-dependent oxidoreductase [Hyphomicrobiales bacterium]
MAEILTPDICVIGAGSGGLSVAAAAAAFGVSVVLMEKGKMGGDCLNYGCVPSKAIIAAAKHVTSIREGLEFGIRVGGEVSVNMRKVHAHVHKTIASIAPNDSVERFTALGVKVITSAGKFLDAKTVAAGEYHVKARRFVIATGSSPFIPPTPGLDQINYFTNETIFDNARKLGHLVVIGGGPIGMELAQAHLRLGSEVTVIEGLKVLGNDDPEITAIAVEKMLEEGMVIREQTMVTSFEKRGKTGIRIHLKTQDGEDIIDGSHLLMATGRAANVNGLGLEQAGIAYDRRGIKVTDALRTTNRKAYAIGDVAGGLQFTHVAGYHAGLVIRGLLFRKKAVHNNHIIPWATYTDPEIAHVGMDEYTAKEKFGKISVLRWPYHENDRARTERKTTGMIKLVAGKKGKILGASIVGHNASEMINIWSLAISKNMSLSDVTAYIPPYPTMSEIGKRAAVSYYVPLTRKPLIRGVISFLQKFG